MYCYHVIIVVERQIIFCLSGYNQLYVKMKKSGLLFFISVYVIYLTYYYFTSDNFMNKVVQTFVIFVIVVLGYVVYAKFLKNKFENS